MIIAVDSAFEPVIIDTKTSSALPRGDMMHF